MKYKKLLPLIVGGSIMAIGASPASAVTEQNAIVRAVNLEELSIILSTDSVHFNNDHSGLMKETIGVTGSTNYRGGYKISFSIYGDHNNLENLLTGDMIPSISNNTAESAFPSVGWGYSLDNATYKQVPMDSTKIYETSTAGTFDHDFTIGVNLSDETPSGRYENELMFTIVSDSAYHGADSVTYLQDVDNYICAATDLNEQVQLRDKRDGKKYWITRLRDNKCWMTQNLDLDLSKNMTLTPEDTDINYNWTPMNSTVHGMNNLADYKNSLDYPYSFDPGNFYFIGIDRYDEYGNPIEYGKDCDLYVSECNGFSTSPSALFGTHGHVGNYYNWAAAIATNDASDYIGNQTANTSICPKGWRLPNEFEANIFNLYQADDIAYVTETGDMEFDYISMSQQKSVATFYPYRGNMYRTNYILGYNGGSGGSFGRDGNSKGVPIRCTLRAVGE